MLGSIKCGYLGPPGTFSQEAGISYLGDDSKLVPLKSINQIINEVKLQKVEIGIIPVENSLEGSVNLSMDLLFKETDLIIIGEVVVPIRHYLLASPGVKMNDIKELFSHSQAIGQSNSFINKHLPDARISYTESTALAADLIKGSKSQAMIGSKRISTLYDLNILAADIQDYYQNYTRFLVITHTDNNFSEQDVHDYKDYKTSLICTPEINKAGVLYDILGEFAREEINLTRVESRPTKQQLGEYLFYIDFAGHKDKPEVSRALAGVKKQCGIFKMLGSYLIAEIREGSNEDD